MSISSELIDCIEKSWKKDKKKATNPLKGQGFGIGYLMPWWEGRRVLVGNHEVFHYGIPEPTPEQLVESRAWLHHMVAKIHITNPPLIRLPDELHLTERDVRIWVKCRAAAVLARSSSDRY